MNACTLCRPDLNWLRPSWPLTKRIDENGFELWQNFLVFTRIGFPTIDHKIKYTQILFQKSTDIVRQDVYCSTKAHGYYLLLMSSHFIRIALILICISLVGSLCSLDQGFCEVRVALLWNLNNMNWNVSIILNIRFLMILEVRELIAAQGWFWGKVPNN